jgi:hypothetical protein
MKKQLTYLFALACTAACLSACTDSDDAAGTEPRLTSLHLTTEITPMTGDAPTRVNDAGNSFVEGDLIRLKMITPYVNMGETGSHTWSSTQDNFYLLKWVGATSNWSTDIRNFDIDGDGALETAPSFSYLPQQTPYVFTANTWSECVGYEFFSTSGGFRVDYKNVFYADQSTQAHYRSSDLLWAQTIMQTGTDNVHLCFNHVMSCLEVTVDNQSGTELGSPVVTLEGVPDIDQGEVVVGNKYSKYDYNVLYSKQKYCAGYVSQTTDDSENGKALGIASLSSDGTTLNLVRFTTDATTDGKVANTGTYIGYNTGTNVWRFIVPPFKGSNVKVWLRDGARRYSISMGDGFTFEPSKCYKVTFSIAAPSTPSNP